MMHHKIKLKIQSELLTCVLVTLCLASFTTAKFPFPRVRMIS